VLAWMAQRTSHVIPVIGVSTVAQLDAAVTAVSTDLGTGTVAALDRARAC